MLSPALRPRERDALIQSLRAGVTPLLGARHIQVGSDAEIVALDKIWIASLTVAQLFAW